MARKARIESAGNGWVLICTESQPGQSGDQVGQKLVFVNWPDLLAAVSKWIGPASRPSGE